MAPHSWRITPAHPLAGEHYPRNEPELHQWLLDEEGARAYFEDVRFRDGIACVLCGADDVARSTKGRWWCSACRRSFTVTTGTIMERTHVPLLTWLRVAWHMTNTKAGISTLSIERSMGLNHKTAWHLTHKIRTAMGQARGAKLSGTVELDETYVGGHEEGGQGAAAASSNKSCVIIAAEQSTIPDRKNPGSTVTVAGRIRMRRSYDASIYCLEMFISENIAPGSTLLTDGWLNYPPALRRLKDTHGLMYLHKPVSVRASTKPAHALLPGVHRAASLLKRWLSGIHQGAVRDHQLDHYLDEFVFRYNRRGSTSRGLLFWRLICQLTLVAPVTRENITDRKEELEAEDAVTAAASEKVREDVKRETARVGLERRKASKGAGRTPAVPTAPDNPFGPIDE